jgi:peptide subunit release factor 1 (eRF1)
MTEDEIKKLVIDAERRGLRRAVEICTYVIKNYDVMKPCGTVYESLKVQKAAKGMVSLARQDIRAALEELQ